MSDDHPGDDALVAHALNELDDGERRRIASHLDGCEECRRAVDAFTRAIDGVRAGPRPDAPMRVLVDLLEMQSERTQPRSRPTWVPLRRAVPVLAALAVLFLAGFWAGRQSAPTVTPKVARPTVEPAAEIRLPAPPSLGFESATPLEASLRLDGGPGGWVRRLIAFQLAQGS